MPKFVVSTTLKEPEWNNTTVLDSGDATADVRRLKDDFDGVLQVRAAIGSCRSWSRAASSTRST